MCARNIGGSKVSHISIKRVHHATHTEAKKLADKVAAKLAKEYELRSHWEDDVLHFDRSGVNGTLSVGPKEFHVEVKLGFLMAAFKGPLQQAMEKNLDSLIPAAQQKVAAAKAPAKKPAKKG
jgi:putative polyhydroxyalkanoate system protein